MPARDCDRPPELAELRQRGPAEQTLQWMFTHRGYFHGERERVLWREWPAGTPRVAIAAPGGYFREVRRMTRRPRGRECEIGIFAIADDWQAAGPGFGMRLWTP